MASPVIRFDIIHILIIIEKHCAFLPPQNINEEQPFIASVLTNLVVIPHVPTLD